MLIMQKLSIITGLAAILAAVALLFLWPGISGKFRMKVYALIIAALVYGVIWFILCYIVAIGMFLLGWL